MTKHDIIKIAFKVEKMPGTPHEEKIRIFRTTHENTINEALELIADCKHDLLLLEKYERWLKDDVPITCDRYKDGCLRTDCDGTRKECNFYYDEGIER